MGVRGVVTGGADPGHPLTAIVARSDDRPVADVLVVGLGASGLTAAIALARRGLDVLAVDAVGIGAGAAGHNGGFLLAGLARFHHDAVAAYGRARADAWYAATLAELDRTFVEEPSARRTGSLRVAASEDEVVDIARQHDALVDSGFPVAPYDGPHGRGILVPSDGRFEPMARCRRLAADAVAAGVRLGRLRVRDVGSGRVVDVAGRAFVAPAVVVAVDGGLERLFPDLGVRTARLQMLATAPAAPGTLERPVYRRHGLDYLRQADDGALHVGGGRDLEDDCWTSDGTTTAAVQAHLDGELARLGVSAAVTRRWASHAAWTPDRLPVCMTPMPGVHVLGGYSGHGNVVGTLLARHVAAQVAAGADRVTLPH